jgi:hypothetical protein
VLDRRHRSVTRTRVNAARWLLMWPTRYATPARPATRTSSWHLRDFTGPSDGCDRAARRVLTAGMRHLETACASDWSDECSLSGRNG